MSEKPKLAVGVSVLLVYGNSVLLGKRKNNSGAGILSTPGGRLEETETFLQCAAREFKEECGAELLGHLTTIGWKEHFRFGKHYIMFYVKATSWGGDIVNVEPEKCEGWCWHDIEETLQTTVIRGLDFCTEPVDILETLAGYRIPAKEALLRYGKHLSWCTRAPGGNNVASCNCGYSDALEGRR